MKKIIFGFISIFFLLVVLIQPVRKVAKADFDPRKWVMCSLGEEGKLLLKAAQTDYIPYLLLSKATTGRGDKPDNIYNSMLSASGYNIGANTSAFEKFGFGGLKFVSYTGEWKYYDVDVCDYGDRQMPVSTNYGIYYEGRLDPLSSYEEIYSTQDVRTIEYSRGRFNAFIKALSNNFINTIVGIAKFILALMLSVLSLSFTDISSLLGMDLNAQTSLFTKFYKGMFLPLSTAMMIITACYIIYYGLIKRQARESINMLAKSLLSFVIMIFFANNVKLIALPNQMITSLQAIVVSSLTGNITNDNSGTSICDVEIPNKNSDILSPTFLEDNNKYIKTVLGCRMWSEFLVKPLIKGQFGTDYGDLDELKNENEKWVGNPEVKIGENTISNWGLFYISVMSGNHTPIDGMNTPLVGGINKDYYRIVDALSNYDEETQKDEDEEEDNRGEGYITIPKGTMTNDIPIPKNNTPLKEWDNFIGNHDGDKLGMSFVMMLFTIVGSIAPLFFSMMSTVQGIMVTILTVLAPIFLLLGCIAVKGNEILKKYLGSFISVALKKIGYTFLTILSLIMVTNTMALIDKVGYIKSLGFFIIITIILIKMKDKIINSIFTINFGTLGFNSFKEMGNSVKAFMKSTAKTGVSGVAGGIGSVKNGGNFVDGANLAMLHNIRQQAYMNPVTRKAATVYDNIKKGRKPESDRFCVMCGESILENSIAYVDNDNNYYCEVCASSKGYEDLTMVNIDNVRDNDNEYAQATKNEDIVTLNNGEKVKHFNNQEYSELINNNSDIDIINEELKKRIGDSVSIIRQDQRKIDKTGLPQTNFNIPNYLQSIEVNKTQINNQTLQQMMIKQKQGKIRNNSINRLLEKGCYEWYKTQAKNLGLTDENMKNNINDIKEQVFKQEISHEKP